MEYNKNLEALKQTRPSFYKKIVELNEESIEKQVDGIETKPARDQNPIAVITKNGKEYRLNSAFHPIEEAKKWVQQYTFHNLNNNVTMYGFGNGYFVKALLEKMPKEDHLFIYEPCAELFLHVLKYYDLESILLDTRVVIGVEGINEFDFQKSIRNVYEVVNLGNSIITMHPVYEKIFLSKFESFKEEIRSSAQSARIYYNTLRLLAKKTFSNTFINIPKLRDSISITELKPEWNPDIPVIIVSAGPSVEESIEELKRINGRALMVAVDRILDYLLNEGIKPDFVVTLDAKKNIKNFTKRDHIDVPMFCAGQAQPGIMDKQDGKKIVCWTNDYMRKKYQSVLSDFPNVPTSGSVATYAAEILKFLGTKKIFLVGQDLAYHGEFTHAGGVISNPHSDYAQMVEGLNGEKVKSRYDWMEYKTWFEEFIIMNPTIELIDTKKRGALIKGSTLMSLSEGLERYGVPSADEITKKVSNMKPTFSEEDFGTMRLEMIQEKEELEQLKRKAKEGASYCNDIINLVKQNKAHSRSIDSKAEKISKINEYLKKNDFYPNISDMVIDYMNDKYIKIFTTKEDENENLLNVFDSSRSFFESIVECAKYADTILGETIQALE